jgi:hypothetical protein
VDFPAADARLVRHHLRGKESPRKDLCLASSRLLCWCHAHGLGLEPPRGDCPPEALAQGLQQAEERHAMTGSQPRDACDWGEACGGLLALLGGRERASERQAEETSASASASES